MLQEQSLPVIALTLGDAAGIGPELVAKLFAAPTAERSTVATVLVGDDWLWREGQRVAGAEISTIAISSIKDGRRLRAGEVGFVSTDSVSSNVIPGSVDASSGRGSIAALRLCLEGALADDVDAICFAPLNKASMKAGGLSCEDELHFFADYLGVENYFCEFNTLQSIWTSRLSSHVPLKNIFPLITEERICAAVALTAQTLRSAGYDAPRIAVAALNPHGGDNGTCGREEIDIIKPAIARLNGEGVLVEGPYPADTIFQRARDGALDAIVTMYHDQGQIAIKLLGFERGVTVQGGLPLPITTPAHGTAFDIVGQGVANPGPMIAAFDLAARMAARHRMAKFSGAQT